MNERIKELAEQNGFIHVNMTVGEQNDALLKFQRITDLVINECISTIKNAENGYSDYRNQIEDGMRDHCIALLKDKFGMKE